jgi:rhodanese-related sulfurtransferase
MRKSYFLCMVFVLACSIISLALAAEIPKETSKQTTLGKYVTAVEAYEMYTSGQGSVSILDVRTPQEYDFVGHPSMAYNIPVKLWTGKFNAETKRNGLIDNPDFVSQVKAHFKTSDVIVAMCRSGDRSAAAVNKLASAGFVNVYTVVDGFEGDMVTDKNSPDFGKRLGAGWKNAPIPWTYDLNETLVYVAP